MDPWMTFELKDPDASLLFAPPTGPPPYKSLDLVLRQCDLHGLDPAAEQAFTLFSSFTRVWKQNRSRHILDAEKMLRSLSPAGSQYTVLSDRLPGRRFSGDGYLDRARYFSVCRDDGFDSGTMLRELTAYHDPLTDGPVEIRDAAERVPPAGEPPSGPEAAPGDGPGGILVSVPPYTATRHGWLSDAVRRWDTTTVLLPVRTTRQRFERLIDLRDPEVASWFTYELTRLRWITGDGSDARAFPNKEPLDEVTDLLPSLMTQYQGGGNGANRIAGQWLRSLGADGLVFPSARSDSRVEADHGTVRDFYGWNLVDYRGASHARQQTYDLTPGWTTRVSNEIDERPMPHQADVFLERETQGRTRGSWHWRNIEESNLAARLLASALYLYDWAWDGAAAARKEEFTLLLGGTDRAHDLARTSAVFVLALPGNERARQAIIDVAGTLTPEQAQFIDITGTFARMDARLAVGRAGGLA
jgi:hypothetical protein